MVDAFNIASLENKIIELWLYGSESIWGYKQFFDKKRISFNNPKIHFAGKVSQLQLAEAFSDSALAIIPSLSSKRLDPFPLISIEAQASGCPVIVTRCGGLPEGLIAGKTGFILEKEDPYDLSALILNFFGNIQLMENMRINAREHVKENFNWEYIAEQFVQAGRKAPKRTNIKIFSERKEEKKRILFICQQIPCYDRAGGDFRTFRIMRQLALEGHKVKLIARDDLPDYYLEMSEVE